MTQIFMIKRFYSLYVLLGILVCLGNFSHAQDVPAPLAKVVDFDFEGSDYEGTEYLTDKIAGLQGTFRPNPDRPYGAFPWPGYKNGSQGIDFARHPHLTRVVVLPARLKQYLDPSGDGYTISCWIEIGDEGDGENMIFWGAQPDGVLITGMRMQRHFWPRGTPMTSKFIMDRYIDWVAPRRHWKMEAWRRDMFSIEYGWCKIVMSVTRDKIYLKTYHPGQLIGLDATKSGQTELTYIGGQDLDAATEFGFGEWQGDPESDAINTLDDFVIYNRAMTYQEMDQIYLAEISSQGGGGGTPETPLVKEDTQFRVFPNPFNDEVTVQVQGATGGVVQYFIINQLGILMMEGVIEGETGVVNTQALPPGVYILRAQSNGVRRTVKIVKK